MDEIFKKLVKEKMSPNSLYVLYCMKNNIVPSSIVNKDLAVHRLISDEWLTEDLQLTNKSVIFVEEINSYFRKSKKKTSKDIMGDDFEVCIKTYNEIFPARS